MEGLLHRISQERSLRCRIAELINSVSRCGPMIKPELRVTRIARPKLCGRYHKPADVLDCCLGGAIDPGPCPQLLRSPTCLTCSCVTDCPNSAEEDP